MKGMQRPVEQKQLRTGRDQRAESESTRLLSALEAENGDNGAEESLMQSHEQHIHSEVYLIRPEIIDEDNDQATASYTQKERNRVREGRLPPEADDA
jgi:hypothetical protein